MTITKILEEIKKLSMHDRIKLVEEALHLIDEDLHKSTKKHIQIHPFRMNNEEDDIMKDIIKYPIDECALK